MDGLAAPPAPPHASRAALISHSASLPWLRGRSGRRGSESGTPQCAHCRHRAGSVGRHSGPGGSGHSGDQPGLPSRGNAHALGHRQCWWRPRSGLSSRAGRSAVRPACAVGPEAPLCSRWAKAECSRHTAVTGPASDVRMAGALPAQQGTLSTLSPGGVTHMLAGERARSGDPRPGRH